MKTKTISLLAITTALFITIACYDYPGDTRSLIKGLIWSVIFYSTYLFLREQVLNLWGDD